jgi:acyl carrier protein
MGLDIVEMVMNVEERFGVTIPDAEAAHLVTVGDLYNFLLHRRGAVLAGVCLSGAIFYRARRALCQLYGRQRQEVCPEAWLEDLLPAGQRRWHWRRLREALHPLSLPDLQRPLWLRVALFAGLSAVSLGSLVAGVMQLPVVPAAPILFGVFLAVMLTHLLTRRLAVCLPWGCTTIRGLVRSMGGDRDRAFSDLQRLDEQDVWQELCQIIGTNLGVDPTGLKPETSFVYDLGAD